MTAQQLRTQALELLKQAQALDGVKPYVVTHRHEYGSSVYILWGADMPSEEEAIAVLHSTYEPDIGETLIIDSITVDELI